MANLTKELYNIITSEDGYDGFVVCHECTFEEAIGCLLGLIDEADKYEGNYKVVPTRKEIFNLVGAYADFVGTANNYIKLKNADRETCFFLGMLCNLTEEKAMSFIDYVFDSWNAWVMDIIDKKYRYAHLTKMVYDSWLEYEFKKQKGMV